VLFLLKWLYYAVLTVHWEVPIQPTQILRTLCTVDFDTQKIFAVSLTVARVFIMYVASSIARLSIYSFKKTPSLFHLLNNMNSKEKV